jgi:acyl dehydratase
MEARLVEGDGGVATLVRAALPAVPGVNLLPGVRKTGGDDLTGLVFRRPALEIRREHVTAYDAVCGFPVKDTVPLTYPHLLGFPLHLRVMTDPAFPFAAVGSVHLTNTITAHRTITVGETVEVIVWPENLQPHAKGRTVDFVTEVTAGGELVWESRSTYLRRGPADDHGSTDAVIAPVDEDVPTSGLTWRLEGDLGRRYASVSGDRNPIHLYGLTAKALGFKRQIAHGMWSKARCVAALENRLPDAVTVEVAFKKPVFLPGEVAFGSVQTDEGFAFVLRDPRSGAPHLQGRTTRV